MSGAGTRVERQNGLVKKFCVIIIPIIPEMFHEKQKQNKIERTQLNNKLIITAKAVVPGRATLTAASARLRSYLCVVSTAIAIEMQKHIFPPSVLYLHRSVTLFLYKK